MRVCPFVRHALVARPRVGRAQCPDESTVPASVGRVSSASLSVGEVFPVRGYPQYTYQQQEAAERAVKRYETGGSGVLLMYGPSKSGKSVLVRKVLSTALYVEAPNSDTAEGLWASANAALGTHTTRSKGDETSDAHELGIGGGLTGIAQIIGSWKWTKSRKNSRGATATDPSNIVVTKMLLKKKRLLIIDDLHMLHRDEQRKILQNLKPFVDAGGRVVLIASGHRAEFIPTLVPNMAGSFTTVRFGLWSGPDQLKRLAQIAKDGWVKLRMQAPAGLAETLAENSFGSPQTMQRLSAAVVEANGFDAATSELTELSAPKDWDDFYMNSLDPVLSEVRWVKRLTKGPEGKPRDKYPTHSYGPSDGYRLIMLALRDLLPQVDIDVNVLQRRIIELTKDEPLPGVTLPCPRKVETVTKLGLMSKSAATDLLDELDETQLEALVEQSGADPVLEYQKQNNQVRIVDPLFAFALRWWPI